MVLALTFTSAISNLGVVFGGLAKCQPASAVHQDGPHDRSFHRRALLWFKNMTKHWASAFGTIFVQFGRRAARRALTRDIGSDFQTVIPAARCCNSARNSRTLNPIARAVVSARRSLGPRTTPIR